MNILNFVNRAKIDFYFGRFRAGSISLAAPAAVAIADQGVISLLNFGINFSIARLCPETEYGGFVLGFSIYIIALGLQTALITNPMSVFGASMQKRAFRAYAGRLLVVQLFFALATSALALGVMKIFSNLKSNSSFEQGMLLSFTVFIFFFSTERVFSAAFAYPNSGHRSLCVRYHLCCDRDNLAYWSLAPSRGELDPCEPGPSLSHHRVFQPFCGFGIGFNLCWFPM